MYLRLDTSGGSLGAGYYMLPPARLKPIRERILKEPDRFKAMLTGLKRRKLTLSNEHSLTAMPRGFEAHSDHPLADYIRYKSFVVMVPLTRTDWISGKVVDKAAKLGRDAADLIRFGQG